MKPFWYIHPSNRLADIKTFVNAKYQVQHTKQAFVYFYAKIVQTNMALSALCPP